MAKQDQSEPVALPRGYDQLPADLQAELARRFTYHPPKPGAAESFQQLRAQALILAILICTNCPAGRERANALTRLEETIMHANAAIARE
jgi:hypothetical protein